ncbi:MAG: DUF3047 domain-containing protein [Gammaproteobacteria bacterium]|nr:MAG: DUF3047 domain-containing protein [Gammaproteobacteria bacterium]
MVEHPRFSFLIWLAILMSGSYSIPLYSDTFVSQEISNFSAKGLADWGEKSFKGNTSYQVVDLDGEQVLQALSLASASGLYKKRHINLKITPYLNWRWRIENRIDSGDETTKSGDDYAARIYLIIDGGLLFWKTSALSYVWANAAVKGSTWDNAYAGKSVKMLALRSAGDVTKKWLTEKRNVYEDLKKVFGKEISTIDAVAVMTDTDNSGSKAKSYYANIFFSAK